MVATEAGLDCVVSSEPRCDMADTPRSTSTDCYYCDQAPGPESGSTPHRVEDFCASWSSFASRICPCVDPESSSGSEAPVEQPPTMETSTMMLGVGFIVGGILIFALIYKLLG